MLKSKDMDGAWYLKLIKEPPHINSSFSLQLTLPFVISSTSRLAIDELLEGKKGVGEQ